MRLVLRMLAAVFCAATLGLTSPALAAGGYAITAGSQTTGETTFHGTSGVIEWNISTGLNFTCDSGSTIEGVFDLGPAQEGSGAGAITSSDFKNCALPLGLPVDWTQTAAWSIDLTGAPGTVTDLQITNVSEHVSNPDGQCDFDFTGSIDANFDSSNQTLNLTGGNALTISNVSGCFGLINDGDTMDLIATYDLDVLAGPLAVTPS